MCRFGFQFASLETIISGLVDEFPILGAGHLKVGEYRVPRKLVFTALVCFIMFLCGLPMTTNVSFNVYNLYLLHFTMLYYIALY